MEITYVVAYHHIEIRLGQWWVILSHPVILCLGTHLLYRIIRVNSIYVLQCPIDIWYFEHIFFMSFRYDKIICLSYTNFYSYVVHGHPLNSNNYYSTYNHIKLIIPIPESHKHFICAKRQPEKQTYMESFIVADTTYIYQVSDVSFCQKSKKLTNR